MLTFPAFQDRVIVMVTGLILVLGLAYLVNRLRVRGGSKSAGDIQETSRNHNDWKCSG